MFQVLRNGPLRYILYTCPNLWCNSCSKCYTQWTASVHTRDTCPNLWCNSCWKRYAMDLFGTYSTHAQTCDVTRVQSATQWTASVHTRDTCPNLWCNSCWKCYAMDCFGTYTLRMPKLWCNSCSKCYLMDRFGTYSTHAQTCDVTRVPSATQWTASVHTLHIPKPVM